VIAVQAGCKMFRSAIRYVNVLPYWIIWNIIVKSFKLYVYMFKTFFGTYLYPLVVFAYNCMPSVNSISELYFGSLWSGGWVTVMWLLGVLTAVVSDQSIFSLEKRGEILTGKPCKQLLGTEPQKNTFLPPKTTPTLKVYFSLLLDGVNCST